MRSLNVHPTNTTTAPGVLVFNMPFAAPASYKHGAKLIDCLAPICSYLAVVGDQRIDLHNHPAHVVRYGNLPTLHYLDSVHPKLWSLILWILKLLCVLATTTGAIVRLRRNIDIVICFQGVYYTPVLLCAKLLGKRVLIYLPNSDAALAEITYTGRFGAKALVTMLRLLQSINRWLADLCTIESSYLLDALQLRPYISKVRIANLYVDTGHYTDRTPLDRRRPLVGYVGRLSAGKGVGALVDAAAALRDSGVCFEIVGDGPLRGEIELLLQRPELSHVSLMGWADSTVLVERLNQYRLLVLPTDSEGLPNIILEAMACGTPVLATPVGGIPDAVKDRMTGFVLSDTDPRTIAHGIKLALAAPELLDIANQGRQHVISRYSLKASSANWQQLLSNLL
jgi:glycosyltransferase involved in cell wall biosynthesis